MLSVTEQELGIVGYRAECGSFILENSKSAPCRWKSTTLGLSTLADDVLIQHFSSAHAGQPPAALVGYVVPVDLYTTPIGIDMAKKG